MKKKRLEIIIFVFLSSVMLAIFIIAYYNKHVGDLKKIVFPSGQNDFSLIDGMQVKGSNDASSRSNVDLKLTPGQNFDGMMIVKNHKPEERKFSVEPQAFQLSQDSQKDTGTSTDAPLPDLILDKTEFILPGDGVKFVNYKISVSDKVKPGNYEAGIIAELKGDDQNKISYKGLEVGTALLSHIRIKVSDTDSGIEYEKRSDIIYKYAKIRLTNTLRWAGGFALLILTLYLIIKGLRHK